MASGVYGIFNKVSDKIYIGQALDVAKRWRQHRHRLNKGDHDNPKLQASWNKHGEDAFDFILLQECPKEDLGAEEIRFLDAVPAAQRYNLGVAGANPTLGIKKSPEQRTNTSRGKGGRPFFAKNIATGEIRRFEHQGEAADAGFNSGHVHDCLNGKRPRHEGHVFFYDPDAKATPTVHQPPKEKRNREIIGTEIATGIETIFSSVTDAAKKTGFRRNAITQCLSGFMKTHPAGLWMWRYADGLPHKQMPAEQRQKLSEIKKKSDNARRLRVAR